MRGEAGGDQDQFGRVATPRVVDADLGVLDRPAGRHDVPRRHRQTRIDVEGRGIDPQALLDGAHSSSRVFNGGRKRVPTSDRNVPVYTSTNPMIALPSTCR